MNIFLIPELVPFSVLAGFILVLLVLEICLMLVGASSQIEIAGLEAEANIDAITLDGAGLTADDIALLELPHDQPQTAPPRAAALLRLIGLGRGPLLIWLTCLAAGLSSAGFFLQFIAQGALGAMLPAGLALMVVFVPGVLLGGRLAALAAHLLPSFESHAVSGQTYHGRRGHVVIGAAARGAPAQVRWSDMYGTIHSLMAEPLRDHQTIPAGTEVLIVKTRDRQPRIVSLSAS